MDVAHFFLNHKTDFTQKCIISTVRTNKKILKSQLQDTRSLKAKGEIVKTIGIGSTFIVI